MIVISLKVGLCFGQNYRFNKLVGTKFSTEYFPNQKHENLFNSEDYSYYMQIYTFNDSVFSRIFDTKNKITHNFYCKDKENLKFEYLSSSLLKNKNQNYQLEFSEINNVKGKSKVIFKILNSIGRKKARYKL